MNCGKDGLICEKRELCEIKGLLGEKGIGNDKGLWERLIGGMTRHHDGEGDCGRKGTVAQ